jgi:hypothetical protein
LRSIVRILSSLALILALAVPALQAAPKDAKSKSKETSAPKNATPSVANVDTDWHLGIVGGLSIPTGSLSYTGGQDLGFNGGLYLEKDLDHEFTLNLGLDFHLLDNKPPVAGLSPLLILDPSLNIKWNLINDSSMKIYWLGGMSYTSQAFITENFNGNSTAYSTWNFGLRTGLGAEFPLGPSDAIVADFLWDILFSVPESIFLPIRIGYEFKL